LQSCTVSDEHCAGWQLDEEIWFSNGSPQHACPDMQSEDALQFSPSTQDMSVFSQVPLSEHLNEVFSLLQTNTPVHEHGSPASVSGQMGGGVL
jgi:hypothetical protein